MTNEPVAPTASPGTGNTAAEVSDYGRIAVFITRAKPDRRERDTDHDLWESPWNPSLNVPISAAASTSRSGGWASRPVPPRPGMPPHRPDSPCGSTSR